MTVSIRRLIARTPLGALALITVLAVVGPWIARADPLLRVDAPFLPPTTTHLLGTDEIGRDLLSRVLYGIRTTWLLSWMVIAISATIGIVLASLGAICGPLISKLVDRLTDLFMVVPGTLIALAAVQVIGTGSWHTVEALGLFWWPWYARLATVELRTVATRPHVEAARMAGADRGRLLVRHMLPAAVPTLLVAATLDVANVVLVLSVFSFLGLGTPPPSPELGAMTARSLVDLTTHPWIPLMPALAIFVMVLSANLAGDAMNAEMEAH